MAGGMGTTAVTNYNKALFQGVTWANVLTNATSSPITIIACAGHTASPSGATQDTNEIAYTSYVRFQANRDATSAGFTCSGATVALGQTLSFAAGTGGSGTMTHGSFGKTASGATEMFYWGTVTPNIVCGSGVTPQWTTTAFLTIAT